jgi:putative peptidoglycan lipid II flippase
VNRRIFAGMLTVGLLGLTVKLAATARELIVAQRFGTQDAVDAFLIAFALPTLAINVVSGSLGAALIPTFIQVREHRGQAAAQRLLSNVISVTAAVLVCAAVLLGLLGPVLLPLLGARFGAEKLALTRSLYLVLLPVIVVSGVSTIWSAILNAGERFALTSLAPLATPVVSAGALLLFADSWGIRALAAGTALGYAIEAAVLARGLHRQGYAVLPRWTGMDEATRQVIGLYLPMLAGSLMMSFTTVVDQSMAARLSPGSVSALGYGNKLVAVLLGLGAMSLSTAVLPHFSRMVARSDWPGVRHTLRTYRRLILLVTTPLVLVGVLLSRPVVALLFQRGAFTPGDTDLVARVQSFYLLQVPLYLLGILGVRLVAAMNQQRLLMWVAAVSLAVNIAADLLLMRWLGVAGIALATAVVYLNSAAIVHLFLDRELRKHLAGAS